MNKNNQLLTEDQEDRLRMVCLGVGHADLSDLSDAQIEEYQIGLQSKLAADSPTKSSSHFVDRRFRLALTAVALAAVVCLISFWSINSAIAYQRERIRQVFADSLIDFALDVYEEDVGVLYGRLEQAEVLIPKPSYWSSEQLDDRKVVACARVLKSLQSARLGFPRESLQQLDDARELLKMAAKSEQGAERLDFIFQLLSGKACLEISDMAVHRHDDWVASRQNIRNDGRLAVSNALQLLSNRGVQGSIEPKQLKLLEAGLLTDLARIESRVAIPDLTLAQGLELANSRLDQANEALFAAAAQNPEIESTGRWQFLHARVLNNRILNLQRLHEAGPLGPQELSQIVDQWHEAVLQACDRPVSKEDPSYSAVAFERGLCFSNLADIIDHCLKWKQGEIDENESKLLDRDSSFRLQAIEYLEKISRVNRTERHFENLGLNYGRYLRNKLRQMTLQAHHEQKKTVVIPGEFTRIASQLHFPMGNVLNEPVGQISMPTRIAIALCLPNKYSRTEIRKAFSSAKMLKGFRFDWIKLALEMEFNLE